MFLTFIYLVCLAACWVAAYKQRSLIVSGRATITQEADTQLTERDVVQNGWLGIEATPSGLFFIGFVGILAVPIWVVLWKALPIAIDKFNGYKHTD